MKSTKKSNAEVPQAEPAPTRKPTIAMVNAGLRELMDNNDWSVADIWRAMYDAAPAAVAPEAPMTATELANAPRDDGFPSTLRMLAKTLSACYSGQLQEALNDAAARIESLQARLNAPVLKSEWQQMEADLAASRERERTARQLLQRLVDWADADEPYDSPVSEKTIVSLAWDVRKYLASPDSATEQGETK